MKKVTICTILSLHLFANVNFMEFFKIPMLVSHFSEHQSENKNLTFLLFLKMHYSEKSEHSKNRHQDSKLPFKSSQGLVSQSFVCGILIFDDYVFIELKSIFSDITSTLFSYCNSFPIGYNHSIWQPPKFF